MTESAAHRVRDLVLVPREDPPYRPGRNADTCAYKCGSACARPDPNLTGNPHIGDVVEAVISRRSLLRGALAAALVVSAGRRLGPDPAHAAAAPGLPGAGDLPGKDYTGELTFEALGGSTADRLQVPEGYTATVLLAWGDPVVAGASQFDPHDQSARAQAAQFGYNCDYVALLPMTAVPGDPSALLVVNHESTIETLMFPGVTSQTGTTDQQKRIALMAHGISVVRVERTAAGGWRLSEDRSLNRRVTMTTRMWMTGPAAGSPYLRTTEDPDGRSVRGTLNDCAGGTTPWGTTLHGEENFDGYFRAGPASALADPPGAPGAYARYAARQESRKGWEQVDPRFDLTLEPNEFHRFGWVVELDPFDPRSVPRKRTALGRFNHEGATVRVAEDGRVVVYSGDDARGEYIYKFVSRGTYDPGTGSTARAHNLTLLDDGDLYVARFEGDSPDFAANTLPADREYDGFGRWLPLVVDGQSAVPGKSVDWVLTFTRLAADRLGKLLDDGGDYVAADGTPIARAADAVVVDPAMLPTRMDRPEGVETNPVTGRVYAALTKNQGSAGRGTAIPADEANPITRSVTGLGSSTRTSAGNNNGYVMEWEELGGAAGTSFTWRLFLVAGRRDARETYFAGFPKDQVSDISCPDNVAFDPAGNLWLSTDGNAIGSNDGLFAVPVDGGARGHVRRFLTVPVAAEATGPVISADARSLLLSVQHPGSSSGATFAQPGSTWPDPAAGYPRPGVVCVVRDDGGYIGR